MVKNWFYKKIFKMPSWAKPELNVPIYYVHLGILSFVVLLILQLLYGGDMLSVAKVLGSIPLLAVGDFCAHSLLKIS